ncbi:MAG: putative Preprotein translocase SecE subunit [Pseudomonadota bacterium]|jgi:preprotein translocase subunit SecE
MAEAAMAKTSPAEFIREVKREVAKVTWPTRKETTVSTVMVFIMVVVAALFFLLVDQVIAFGIRLVLGIGG